MAAMDTGQSLITLSEDLRVAANTESSRAELLAALKFTHNVYVFGTVDSEQ